MESTSTVAYSVLLPIGVTLIVLTAVATGAYISSIQKLRFREPDRPMATIHKRPNTTEELSSSIQESESLASAVSNPIADPVVHLRGAAKVVPTSYHDTAKKVLEHLHSTRVVILDLAAADETLASRLVDFCSGVTLGSKGWIYSVSSTTILLTPKTD